MLSAAGGVCDRRSGPCSAQGPQQWRWLGDAIASFLVAQGLAMLALRALIANHVNKGADSPLASPLPSPRLLCSWPYGHAVVSSPGDVRDPLASSTCPLSTSSVPRPCAVAGNLRPRLRVFGSAPARPCRFNIRHLHHVIICNNDVITV